MKTVDFKWRVASMLAIVIGVVTLAACGSDQPSAAEVVSSSPGAVPVRVEKVTTGPISVSTAYAAVVESIDEVDVVPLATGRIEKLLVGVGSAVKVGDVMAELSHGTLDAELAEASGELRNAQATLASVKANV